MRQVCSVRTMIGLEGHMHCWTAPPKKSFSEPKKSMHPRKVWLKNCDLEIYAISVLGHIGSISAPDEATLKDEAHALQCTTAGPHNAIPTSLLCVGSVCGFGPELLGIHSLSLAARYKTAANSSTLNQVLEKIRQFVGMILLPFLR